MLVLPGFHHGSNLEAASLPTAIMYLGLTRSICILTQLAHASICSFVGSALLGGLHITTLVMYISLRDTLNLSIKSTKYPPVSPTKGFPCKSSCLPGASPIAIIFALGFPL